MSTATVILAILLLGDCAAAQTKSDEELKHERQEAVERFEKYAAESDRLRQEISQYKRTDTVSPSTDYDEMMREIDRHAEEREASGEKPADTLRASYFTDDFQNLFQHVTIGPKGEAPKKEQATTGGSRAESTTGIFSNKFDQVTMSGVKQVVIGTQVWTAENLNTDRFRNGDIIPEARTTEEWMAAHADRRPVWCYYKNDPANGATYGRLYNWYAVADPRGLAPAGWHIPSQAEWNALDEYLGGGIEVGRKMRSTTGWKPSAAENTNESGFGAKAAGTRGIEGTFYLDGEEACWWTSTPFEGLPTGYGIELNWVSSPGKNIYMKCGLSVRCVKD